MKFAKIAAFSTVLTTAGVSQTALRLNEQARESRLHFENSFTFGAPLERCKHDLCKVFEECNESNWDGYGAEPVSVESYRNAFMFLEALGVAECLPSVSAEPDGHLTFEWYRGPRRSLSVSVSPTGELHYAALFGPSKAFGTETFIGDVPKAILDLIHRVYA
jgi:hypothetical protein